MSLKDYIIHKELGKGISSIAFLATSKIDNRDVVIKMIKPDMVILDDNIIAEFTIGRDAANRCPYIVKHLAVFKDIVPAKLLFDKIYQNKYTSWIVIEYVEGYTLAQYFKCQKDTGYLIDIKDYLRFLEHVFKVIDCLHSNEIIHGDISPGNLYFGTETREPFLIDFGGSCSLNFKPSENWKTGRFSCGVRELQTLRIYSSRFANLKRIDLPLNYSWSSDQLRTILRQNDIHALLTMSCLLLHINLDTKWTKYILKNGWDNVVFDDLRQNYAKYNVDATAIFDFLEQTIKLINDLDESVTAKSVLKSIKLLQTHY